MVLAIGEEAGGAEGKGGAGGTFVTGEVIGAGEAGFEVEGLIVQASSSKPVMSGAGLSAGGEILTGGGEAPPPVDIFES